MKAKGTKEFFVLAAKDNFSFSNLVDNHAQNPVLIQSIMRTSIWKVT